MAGLFDYWFRGRVIARSRSTESRPWDYAYRGVPVAAMRSITVVVGAGSFVAPESSFSGEADVIVDASGAAGVAPCIFQGSADVIVLASGSADLPDSVFSGSSEEVSIGRGSAIIADSIFSGSGIVIVEGSGGFVAPDSVFSGAAPPEGPATFRESLMARLEAVPGLADIVADRIYFGTLPQGSPRPAVTYSVASRTFGRWLESPSRTSQARARVSCWSDTELEAARIADKIRSYFDGFQGRVGQVYWFYANLQNEIDLPEPAGGGDDGMIFQVLLDFTITHSVSLPSYNS